jgi:thymidylate synthase
MNTYRTTHEAYLQTLRDVYFNPDFRCAPRGQPIREKTDYTFRVLEPTSEPIITKDLERNKVIADYTAKEMELYNSCSNRVEDFAKASKFWEKLQNPDGTINSAYGYLIWKNLSHGKNWYENWQDPKEEPVFDYWQNKGMRTPWEWSKQSLISDKDTRQAIMRFSLPEHAWVGVKDFTCTLHGNWLIREDKLNLSMVLRSNDWVKGIAYDMPYFCSLMDKMLEELKPYYPTLSKGYYTHTAHSAHCYEQDNDKILKMLGM